MNVLSVFIFKQNTGSAQILELSPSPVEEILTTQDNADTSTLVTGTQWMKRFIHIESPEKTEGDETISAAEAAGDSARKKKKFIK